MKEINTVEDLKKYITEIAKEEPVIPQQNFHTDIPCVMVTIPTDIKLKGQQIKKGDKFAAYANGTIQPVKAEKVSEFAKSSFTAKEIKKEKSSGFTSITLSSDSPNVGAYMYEFNKNKIGAYTITEFQNRKNAKSKITKFTLIADMEEKLQRIKMDIRQFGNKAKNVEPINKNDIFDVSKCEYVKGSTVSNKFREEFMKAPEQAIDETKKIIEQINDSIRKCEIFLGEMQNAQMSANKDGFNKAKIELQKEVAKLKELEVKAIEKNDGCYTYDKVMAIREINELNNMVQQATIESLDSPHKLNEKLKTHSKNNYFIIYLNDMMNIRENLSLEEQQGVIAASAGTSAVGYDKKTRMAESFREGKINNSDALSDGRDLNYGKNYGELDGVANQTQQPKIDTFDDIMNSETKPYSIDYVNRTIEEEDERDEKERTLIDDNN